MGVFLEYLGGTVARPLGTFGRISEDPKGLAQGARMMFLMGLLYTLTVIGFAVAGSDISLPAWLSIPPSRYYFWEIFFALPVVVLGWVLVAGLIQLASRPLGGRGTYEQTLGVLAFALAVPSFVTWIPETVGCILFLAGAMTQAQWRDIIARPGFWRAFSEAYQYVALAWMLALTCLAAGKAQRLPWGKAIIVGAPCTAAFMGVMLIFIR